jgi:hypothetical protein
MCKEMPVIPVSRVVNPKRIIGQKCMAEEEEEEERHKGWLNHKKVWQPCLAHWRGCDPPIFTA